MLIREYLVEKFQISDEDLLNRLVGMASVRQLKKGELLFKIGEKPESVAFLIKGITRGFVLDSRGKDITECFNRQVMEPLVPSIPLNAPATIGVEAIGASKILCFPMDSIMEMIESDPGILQLYNRLLQISLQTQVEIKDILYQCTAMERYQWFQAHYPGLDGNISSKYIASFLNITPESLSRLRRELRVGARINDKK